MNGAGCAILKLLNFRLHLDRTITLRSLNTLQYSTRHGALSHCPNLKSVHQSNGTTMPDIHYTNENELPLYATMRFTNRSYMITFMSIITSKLQINVSSPPGHHKPGPTPTTSQIRKDQCSVSESILLLSLTTDSSRGRPRGGGP